MNTGYPQGERRAAKRHRVRLTVELDTGEGVTRDFSLAGMYLVTDRPLSVGEDLGLRVVLPDHAQPGPLSLACRGSVVRVEEAGGAVGAAIALSPDSLCLLQASA